ncbi:hypothetical protein F0L68_07410 [Solihabitans fulvus]|uniref:Heparin binding hemagglutinin HbhA n=1 Tax=Solihabitans fulvus TaxID=1892852 RepID=A0A5B2XPL0_9PSEU|nr:hypothetical protein [Solihabitans fulvus]KAA2264890.1 hypothetical protein F0L68_07410 [Solihabitans fulvus]
MSNLPSTEELRKAGEQAAAAARTPLLAALGAGDLAAKAVIDALSKAKSRLDERAGAAKSAVDELPTDFGGLRDKLDPAELRKLLDAYTQSALHLYQYLAERGEETLDRLRTQPQLKRAFEQVGDAVDVAQHRVEEAAGEARVLADDVLGKVSRRTRVTGEKVASATEKVAEDAAEAVVTAAGEVADETRAATRKAAARTTPRKPAARATKASTEKADTEK